MLELNFFWQFSRGFFENVNLFTEVPGVIIKIKNILFHVMIQTHDDT